MLRHPDVAARETSGSLCATRRTTRRQPQRSLRGGRVNTLWLLLLAAGVVLATLAGLLALGGPDASGEKLTVYCAAGLRTPMEEIAALYSDEYGVAVEFQFGGSNTLLNQLQVDRYGTGDLYLAADDFYTATAVEEGLAAETLPVAHQRPVIAVPAGNPKNISTLQDLLADEIQVALANPDQAAVGRITKSALEQIPAGDATLWRRLEEHVTQHGVFKPTVNDVATDVAIGAVDAAIVWDSTVAMPKYRDDLEAVSVPEFDEAAQLISLAVLNSTTQPTAALKFARFVAARDRGLPVFATYGTQPVDGDVWAERPQVTFYCGAVNRRVVEDVVAKFQAREGVDVNTVFDGCGILTGRMKTIKDQSTAGGFPDLYMACDVYYLDNVRDWFQEAVLVSDTEIVIAVPKGATEVQSLEDLLKPGVRVAIGQPEQCTIGALTRRMLVDAGLYEQLKDKQQQDGEVVVEKPSSALLVPDVATGNVDAAIAYITDVRSNLDRVDIVHIDSNMNQAVQPISIARSSDHKYLMRRLHGQISAAREAFERAGFRYRLEKE